MAFSISAAHLASAFGILGNIVSFLVYLAPLPTFYKIYRKKSSQGYQSVPYSVALFSAMLYLYYAFLKKNALMIFTINTLGCAIETLYLLIFLFYATKHDKIHTTKLLVIFNVGALGAIIVSTYLASTGHVRMTIVGWICAIFSVSVFAAPLSIMRQVIRTKSVEFMPLSLSFFLTLCAVMWFFYGLLIKDFYIATPNILGFAFGITQMILYAVYRDRKKKILPEVLKPDQQLTVVIDLKAAMDLMTQQTSPAMTMTTYSPESGRKDLEIVMPPSASADHLSQQPAADGNGDRISMSEIISDERSPDLRPIDSVPAVAA